MEAPVAANLEFRLRSSMKEAAILKRSCSARESESSTFCLPGPHSVWLPDTPIPMSNPRRLAEAGCRLRSSAISGSRLAIASPAIAYWSAGEVRFCPPPAARHFATRSAASGAFRSSADWAASQIEIGTPDAPGVRSFLSFAASCAALHCASRDGAAGEFRARADAASSQIEPWDLPPPDVLTLPSDMAPGSGVTWGGRLQNRPTASSQTPEQIGRAH